MIRPASTIGVSGSLMKNSLSSLSCSSMEIDCFYSSDSASVLAFERLEAALPIASNRKTFSPTLASVFCILVATIPIAYLGTISSKA